MTANETWIHWYTPETKKQDFKKVEGCATIFWDSKDMIYIDYLEKGKTVRIIGSNCRKTGLFDKKNALLP